MQLFMMHVGSPGSIDLDDTVFRKRRLGEFKELRDDSPEKDYLVTDPYLRKSFPNGEFNCWGLPSGAEKRFHETRIGDLVIFIPSIGIHGKAGIQAMGIVKEKCPVRALSASRILWPRTPAQRLFPHIFFFDTETIYRPWCDFLRDVSYDDEWNPKGWYRKIRAERLDKFDGVAGYYTFLMTHDLNRISL